MARLTSGRPKAVLLDTHTLLWYDSAPDLLSPRVTGLLRDRDVTVYVSAVTAWELAIKVRAGKLPEARALLDSYADTMSRLGFIELALSASHALLAGTLEHPHRDPFDRVLVAQAMVERVPLVSRDEVMGSFDTLSVIW